MESEVRGSGAIRRTLVLLLPCLLVAAQGTAPTPAAADGGLVVPSSGVVTTLFVASPYPESWFSSYYDPMNILRASPSGGAHSGVDISNGFSDCQYPVYSAGTGTVAWTGFDTGGFGWSVVVSNGYGVGNNAHYTYTVFGHMGTKGTSASTSQTCVAVQAGQSVTAGLTLVGYQGSSGYATGTHVHWMILVGPTAASTITGPYVPGQSPASPDFYTCLPLTQGDSGPLLNQRVLANQRACPAIPLTDKVFLPSLVDLAAVGW